MFMTRSEYDRGVNTFSPEGRLFQVEYAIEAIKLGSTVVGIRTNEGVVLAVEKRITSPLLEPSSVEKIAEVDSHIGVAMSGLTADARTLVEHARTESQYHRFAFNEPMLAEALTQSICDLALGFGESDEVSMSRPFGVSLLIAAWDESEGPVLYHTDPSGTYSRYDAKAIGSASEGAQTALQEAFKKDMTIAQAEVLAVATLKQVMEEKISDTNISVSTVTLPPATEAEPLKFACHYVPGAARQAVFHIYTTAEVKAVMDRLTA
ncbi:nucleophile aminohydrolase [Pavlovales sp. CCMP2436]|nr:nucleophile aminohydrolase [Pavlovales sp. CCMP2436]